MNKEFKITPQGSLGLLALGHLGVLKWKEVVEKEKKNKTIERNKLKDDKEKK